MVELSTEAHAFLLETRVGLLTTLRRSGEPVPLPVWFEWDGSRAAVFSFAAAAKVRRLRRDPRAWLLVANQVGEPEFWVTLAGSARVGRPGDGAIELAERLAERYWDLDDPNHAATLVDWRARAADLVVVSLEPTAVTAYG